MPRAARAQTADPAPTSERRPRRKRNHLVEDQGPALDLRPQTELVGTLDGNGTVERVERRAVAERVPPGRTARDNRTAVLERMHAARREAHAQLVARELEAARNRNRGRRPVPLEVTVGEIERSTIYNREFQPRKAELIARRFDWDAFQAVTLFRRPDGRYNCVDGQHRLAAVDALYGEDELVPATVSKREGTAVEALTFDTINTMRTSLRHNVRFGARLIGGRPDALLIRELVQAAGLRLDTHLESNTAQDGGITSIRSLVRFLKDGGPMAIAETLHPLRAARGDEAAAYRAHLLGGVYLLAVLFAPRLRPDRLTAVLRTRPPASIAAEAAQYASPAIKRNELTVALALYALYQRGLPEVARLPAFPLDPASAGGSGGRAVRDALRRYKKLYPPDRPETARAARHLLQMADAEWAAYAARRPPAPPTEDAAG